MWLVEKGSPADAHDAGPSAAGGKKEAQLMLMMLGVGAACRKKEAQLMLMMPGVGVACGKKETQLMLMMLVPVRLVGKRRPS